MAVYVTKEGLSQTLQNYTISFKKWLFNWLPIKKNDNHSLDIKVGEEQNINAIHIEHDGKIYVIDTNQNVILLQDRLERMGTISVNKPEDASKYLNESYYGQLIFIIEPGLLNEEEYSSGLYTIGIDTASNQIKLLKLGLTVSSEDLDARVSVLESFANSPIKNDEIDTIIGNK